MSTLLSTSSTSQDVPSSGDRDLQCKICPETFNDEENIPRILTSCGHTICEKCALKLWEMNGKKKIVCPFDRKHTEFTGNINKLQKNWALLDMVAVQGSTLPVEQGESKESEAPNNLPFVPRWCAECEHVDVSFFCETCAMNYCEDCFDEVHSHKVMSRHKKTPIKQPYQLPKCGIHPQDTAEFLCKQKDCKLENKFICTKCLLSAHNGHTIGSLMDVVEKNKEELLKLAREKSWSYHDDKWIDIFLRKNTESYLPGGYDDQLRNVDIHYDWKRKEAKAIIRKFAEMKYPKAKEQEEKLKLGEETLEEMEQIVEDIRTRLESTDNLLCIDDIRLRVEEMDKKVKEARAKKRYIRGMRNMEYVFPKGELKIIDKDVEKQDLEPETSNSEPAVLESEESISDESVSDESDSEEPTSHESNSEFY